MDFAAIISKLLFIVFTLAIALGVPAIVRRIKPELMPDITEQIFKGLLYVYIAIIGVIIPATTWLATSLLR
jgi:hypothetical protein